MTVPHCLWVVLPARIWGICPGYLLLVPKTASFQRAISPLKPEENTPILLQTCELLLYDAELACPLYIKRAWNLPLCFWLPYTHALSWVHEHPGVLAQAHACFEKRMLLIRAVVIPKMKDFFPCIWTLNCKWMTFMLFIRGLFSSHNFSKFLLSYFQTEAEEWF